MAFITALVLPADTDTFWVEYLINTFTGILSFLGFTSQSLSKKQLQYFYFSQLSLADISITDHKNQTPHESPLWLPTHYMINAGL